MQDSLGVLGLEIGVALDTSYWFLLVASINHPANTTLYYSLEEKETDRNSSQSSSSSSPLGIHNPAPKHTNMQ